MTDLLSSAPPSYPGTAQVLRALKAPSHIAAVFEALQLCGAKTQGLDHLSVKEWQTLLDWCDGRQLTLLLPSICKGGIPPAVRLDILNKTNRYAIRFERLKQSLFEIAEALQAANLDFVLLKGLSHAPSMTPDALLRAQGDIDLWFRGTSVYKAQEVLHALGYRPIARSNSRHLGPMARENSWRWQGDLFDPDMPISVELHFELWSAEAEFVAAPELDEFWERRRMRDFDGRNLYVLGDQDLLGFAALHLLLHLLHGDLPLQRAWEIARFLDAHADDKQFWEMWRHTHCVELRQLEMPIYLLIGQWFGCRLPKCVRAEFFSLDSPVRAWLTEFCLAPIINCWKPNKREVWLHLALVKKPGDRVKVLLRRLFPLSLPARPKSPATLVQHFRFLISRLVRHFLTLAPTILDGLRFALPRRW